MKPGYRITASDLVRTLRNLRLDVLERAAAKRDTRGRIPMRRGRRDGGAARSRGDRR